MSVTLCAVSFSCFAYSESVTQAKEESKKRSTPIAVSTKTTVVDESNNWSEPTEEQMQAFQNGDIDELGKYIGKANNVVLACLFKSQWEYLNHDNAGVDRGVLRKYYRIVLSKDSVWKTGNVVIIENVIEDIKSVPASLIKYWENPNGHLAYLFNLRKNYKNEPNFYAECSAERTCSVLTKNTRQYQTLCATLKPKK